MHVHAGQCRCTPPLLHRLQRCGPTFPALTPGRNGGSGHDLRRANMQLSRLEVSDYWANPRRAASEPARQLKSCSLEGSSGHLAQRSREHFPQPSATDSEPSPANPLVFCRGRSVTCNKWPAFSHCCIYHLPTILQQ